MSDVLWRALLQYHFLRSDEQMGAWWPERSRFMIDLCIKSWDQWTDWWFGILCVISYFIYLGLWVYVSSSEECTFLLLGAESRQAHIGLVLHFRALVQPPQLGC